MSEIQPALSLYPNELPGVSEMDQVVTDISKTNAKPSMLGTIFGGTNMTKFTNFSRFQPDQAQLQKLSEEVKRIASTLATIAVTHRVEASPDEGLPANNCPASAAALETVRHAIKARRLRSQFFDQALFSDPAWDMLLELYSAELSQLRVTVSSLCTASAVPSTTALRWISSMTDVGLFQRRPDPFDGRRFFVELSDDASESMRGYFRELRKIQAA